MIMKHNIGNGLQTQTSRSKTHLKSIDKMSIYILFLNLKYGGSGGADTTRWQAHVYCRI
jgi:hypothetical protein